ncbi:VOC family protein [Daejeonella sp. H1SJ63]|uniref:VOC family protein n=1 Tax=Daejeonella sp. H1SJ63 TaxID=3034145 RepID=UPI0023ECD5F9|nr:VOC family protein [Daejeonella sp. H1SJ63]
MTNLIHPCLWFDGQAKAAAELYCSLFKNSAISTDTPMVVTFELEGNKFMGLNGGPQFKINPSISVFVVCQSPEETNHLWEKLIDGGKALIPIGKYDWSERYGWLQDRFGLTWQISLISDAPVKQKIRSSMLFTGDKFGMAESVINFYTSVFDHSSTELLMHYPEGSENAGKVLYSEFKLDHQNMIAMDGPGVHDYTFNEGVSFVVECESQKEIDYYWNRLTEGGQESMCGWLKDKFGVSWQIVPAVLGKLMSDPLKAPNVIQAFLKMKKFDIETLLNA